MSPPEERVPPPLVLVVSDLHLGVGRDRSTGRVDPRENFLADEAFGRFLDHHLPAPTGAAPLLVCNGDAFDFLRVTDIPETPDDFARWDESLGALDYRPVRPLRETLVGKERRYGLRTDDYKTVWKFRVVADGHPEFFSGLRRWLGRGGRIAFVKGDADLELYWPLLQRAIRRELLPEGHGDDGRVTFHQDALQLQNLHLEHGNRFEAISRVNGEPTIYRGEEIRYPFAAFFHKYVINDLERLDPFLDNIKPPSRILLVAIRKHPFSALRILFHGFHALRPILIRDFTRQILALLLVLVTIALPVVVLVVAVLSFIFPPVHAAVTSVIESGTLRRAIGVAGAAAPWLVGGVQDLIRRLRRFPHGEDDWGEKTYQVLGSLPGGWIRRYGVIGHTHQMDVQDLGSVSGGRAVYLNAGSWIARWDETRPDLTGRVEFTFLRFTLAEGEYRHECLEWRDDRGEPAPALILDLHRNA